MQVAYLSIKILVAFLLNKTDGVLEMTGLKSCCIVLTPLRPMWPVRFLGNQNMPMIEQYNNLNFIFTFRVT